MDNKAGWSVPPQNVFFRHKDYFRLINFGAQKTKKNLLLQEKVGQEWMVMSQASPWDGLPWMDP